MTVLPFLDVKATPIRSVESPRLTRTRSFPHVSDINAQQGRRSPQSTGRARKLSISSPVRSSIPSPHVRIPKIRIISRSDEILKKLPHAKTSSARAFNSFTKPFVRDLPDYDYLWEPVHREDIRHQYDSYAAPQRIIASRPEEPYKMSTMFETQDRHYHNYKRVQAMQQRQWNREHTQYTVYPYSHTEERELYNKQIRSTLKEQMEQKVQVEKSELEIKNRATELIIEQDRQILEQEREQQIQRAKLLARVTAKNKELMQNKWNFDQWNRMHQWHVERAILADTPINWSKTMT